ncbi:membrane cofactor protein-like [Watersipora subatra]|uniref:membrane cofactor protein-like n=1 Tax=Watersipora subatra TaxID=2589382 RepID=UPI00355B6E5D
MSGYKMEGESVIKCQSNQEWSSLPQCHKLSCGLLPEVANGAATPPTDTTVRSQARYVCMSGYEMLGEPVVECQTNQQWSTPPQCHKVNCGPPPVVDNSKRQVSGHSYNDTVKYECDVGYDMTEDDIIVCQETGYWTVHPDCEEVACGVPPTLDTAGLVSLTGTQFGQTATYQCLPGYTTDDPLYVTCQLNGEWSHLPNCTQILMKLKVSGDLEEAPSFNETIKELRTATNSVLSTNQIILISCTSAGLLTIIIVATVWRFTKKRKQRDHGVPPVSNAAYEPDAHYESVCPLEERCE